MQKMIVKKKRKKHQKEAEEENNFSGKSGNNLNTVIVIGKSYLIWWQMVYGQTRVYLRKQSRKFSVILT